MKFTESKKSSKSLGSFKPSAKTSARATTNRVDTRPGRNKALMKDEKKDPRAKQKNNKKLNASSEKVQDSNDFNGYQNPQNQYQNQFAMPTFASYSTGQYSNVAQMNSAYAYEQDEYDDYTAVPEYLPYDYPMDEAMMASGRFEWSGATEYQRGDSGRYKKYSPALEKEKQLQLEASNEKNSRAALEMNNSQHMQLGNSSIAYQSWEKDRDSLSKNESDLEGLIFDGTNSEEIIDSFYNKKEETQDNLLLENNEQKETLQLEDSGTKSKKTASKKAPAKKQSKAPAKSLKSLPASTNKKNSKPRKS